MLRSSLGSDLHFGSLPSRLNLGPKQAMKVAEANCCSGLLLLKKGSDAQAWDNINYTFYGII